MNYDQAEEILDHYYLLFSNYMNTPNYFRNPNYSNTIEVQMIEWKDHLDTSKVHRTDLINYIISCS
jgi:hypothetical protein